jgi:hypothetical protein
MREQMKRFGPATGQLEAMRERLAKKLVGERIC